MRRPLNALIASFVFAVLHFPPVLAISNGGIDTDHRNVGAMAIEFEPGVDFSPCSGTLISPRIFLVAAHCLAGFASQLPPAQILVTFDVNYFTASTFVPASAVHFDPAFLTATQADPHDLGVIVLSQDVTHWDGVPVQPASLPPAGLLGSLAAQGGLRGESFVNVGYGIAASFKQGPPHGELDGFRRLSTSPFQALTQTLLKQLMNSDATGEGGVCFLDSGSPKFLPGTNTIVAVQRGGDAVCRAESIASRLDIPQARAFLGQFVALP